MELDGDHEIAPPIAACQAEGPRNNRQIFGWRRYYGWRSRARPCLVPDVSARPLPQPPQKVGADTRTLFELRRFFQNFHPLKAPRAAMMTPMTATAIPP